MLDLAIKFKCKRFILIKIHLFIVQKMFCWITDVKHEQYLYISR